MKAIKIILTIILRIVLISLALLFFFSMMAGMYYKNAPRHIKTVIVDQDHSPLSRSIINNIKASDYYDITGTAVDYTTLKKMIDEGKADLGIMIPPYAYRDVLNHRSVRILAVANGTANPSVPSASLMMLNKIIMTLNIQMGMKLRVQDLGSIPNVRHPKLPLLSVSTRIFYNPLMSMEKSMLPAFMGLAMQIVSMLIVLFSLYDALKKAQIKMSFIKQARQLPLKAIIPPFIISWVIVSTSISTAFFGTMYLFGVPFDNHTLWNVAALISLFVLAMQSISFFLTLNINKGSVMAALITLIVLPAFMYSGFLMSTQQLAYWPNFIGSWFPLRYYLEALFAVFNHHQPFAVVATQINYLWYYVAAFLGLAILSILIGQLERKSRIKKAIREQNSK